MSFVSGKQDIIDLNVGGKPFVTSRATLCVIKGSLLEQTFSLCKKDDSKMPSQIIKTDDNKHFIDRNPALFETVLSYLRLSVADSCLTLEVLPQILTSHNTNDLLLLSLEANFFGLKCLQDLCDNVLKKKNAVVATQRPTRSTKVQDGVIQLDVGGKIFVTTARTLRPFNKVFDFETLHRKRMFIDRNPVMFETILSCMREHASLIENFNCDGRELNKIWNLICAGHTREHMAGLSLEAKHFGMERFESFCKNFVDSANSPKNPKRLKTSGRRTIEV